MLHGITIERSAVAGDLVDRVDLERDIETDDERVHGVVLVRDQVVEVAVKSKRSKSKSRDGEWSLFDGLVEESGVGGV